MDYVYLEPAEARGLEDKLGIELSPNFLPEPNGETVRVGRRENDGVYKVVMIGSATREFEITQDQYEQLEREGY